jgi:hypothetical protein
MESELEALRAFEAQRLQEHAAVDRRARERVHDLITTLAEDRSRDIENQLQAMADARAEALAAEQRQQREAAAHADTEAQIREAAIIEKLDASPLYHVLRSKLIGIAHLSQKTESEDSLYFYEGIGTGKYSLASRQKCEPPHQDVYEYATAFDFKDGQTDIKICELLWQMGLKSKSQKSHFFACSGKGGWDPSQAHNNIFMSVHTPYTRRPKVSSLSDYDLVFNFLSDGTVDHVKRTFSEYVDRSDYHSFYFNSEVIGHYPYRPLPAFSQVARLFEIMSKSNHRLDPVRDTSELANKIIEQVLITVDQDRNNVLSRNRGATGLQGTIDRPAQPQALAELV